MYTLKRFYNGEYFDTVIHRGTMKECLAMVKILKKTHSLPFCLIVSPAPKIQSSFIPKGYISFDAFNENIRKSIN